MRPTKLIIILGYNGTGKTTLISNILKKQSSRSLIVTPDFIEWLDIEEVSLSKRLDYKGIRKVVYNDASTITGIFDNFRDGVVVFDDCRSYFTSRVDRELHALLIRRRQRMFDLIVVGHCF